MKTKLTLIIAFLFVTQVAFSQNYQSVEEINEACSQLGFSGDEDAEIAVDAILDKIGLFRNFIIQECPEINNAVAKNIDVGNGHKERYILYDANFFKKIDDKAANGWAATSVLAHEIGHHLNGHSLNNEGSNHKFELEADEFSGFVLARMGASLEDAQSAIQTLRYEKATRTHPAKADRLLRIEKGWNRGNGKVIEIKKIEEEIVNEIIENEEITEIDGITGQQVLAKYIDAIGGQEKIIGIRTLKQNVIVTSKSVIYNKDYSTSNKMKMSLIYLTPNKYRTEMNFNGSSNHYSLKLDGKSYTKTKKKGKWKFLTNFDAKKQASFINEYSMLVRNDVIKLLGVEEVEGVSCYKVEFPVSITSTKTEAAIIKINISTISFYSVESGLLVLTKTITDSDTDYLKNSKYLKDSKTTTKMDMIFVDYKDIDGVLMPFKVQMKAESDASTSNVTLEYSEISINEEIDKKEFEIND